MDSGGRLFLHFFRSKHTRIMDEAFGKLKIKAALSKAERKRKLLRMFRLIVGGRK